MKTMDKNNIATAVVDFLLMTEEGRYPTERREALKHTDIKEKRKMAIGTILENNKLVRHKKTGGDLSIPGSNITVIFEKTDSQNTKKGIWTVCVPPNGIFTYEEENSEIKKSITGALTALKRNNHADDKAGRDWLATMPCELSVSK